MVRRDEKAYDVIILEGSFGSFKTHKREATRLPNVGDEIELSGRGVYKVVWKKSNNLENPFDWKKYGGKPPTVWVESVRE